MTEDLKTLDKILPYLHPSPLIDGVVIPKKDLREWAINLGKRLRQFSEPCMGNPSEWAFSDGKYCLDCDVFLNANAENYFVLEAQHSEHTLLSHTSGEETTDMRGAYKFLMHIFNLTEDDLK